MIVADAAPVIAFARVGRLALLRQIVEELVVPDAVYDDVVVKGRGKPGADEVARGTWIRRAVIRNRDAVANFPPVLGAGEREAIVLAEEQNATLLTDDQRAREAAEERGLEVVGVLWVLGEAKRRGCVTEVRPLIDELLAIRIDSTITRLASPGHRLHETTPARASVLHTRRVSIRPWPPSTCPS